MDDYIKEATTKLDEMRHVNKVKTLIRKLAEIDSIEADLKDKRDELKKINDMPLSCFSSQQ